MKQTTPKAKPQQPDILIVDDTPANLQLLTGMLKEHGYRVRPVPSGQLAIQAIQKEKPDLILLDINMPEMDGYEVCKELKANGASKDIPVLFISALDETTDKIKAFSAGGVDYVTKPFQFAEVEARVQTHLKLRHLQIELEQRNCQLQEQNAQLKTLEELRDNLTHMVVHDIRSPLMCVSMAFEIISREENLLSPTQKEFVALGKRACSEQVEMVTLLLDVSRMESGQMPLSRSKCEIQEIAREAVESVAVLARDKTLTIRVTGETASANVDREITHRIFVNLLGNAIKFSPAGGTIDLAVFSTAKAVRVTVTDQGQGIPPEHQQRIFDKFGQVASDGQDKKYSTGLGLTFCKLAVETHGGNIGVESPSTPLPPSPGCFGEASRAGKVGKGSTFWFTLPT